MGTQVASQDGVGGVTERKAILEKEAKTMPSASCAFYILNTQGCQMIKFNRGLFFLSEIVKAVCIDLKPREIIDTKQLKQIQTNFRNVKSIFFLHKRFFFVVVIRSFFSKFAIV